MFQVIQQRLLPFPLAGNTAKSDCEVLPAGTPVLLFFLALLLAQPVLLRDLPSVPGEGNENADRDANPVRKRRIASLSNAIGVGVAARTTYGYNKVMKIA